MFMVIVIMLIMLIVLSISIMMLIICIMTCSVCIIIRHLGSQAKAARQKAARWPCLASA